MRRQTLYRGKCGKNWIEGDYITANLIKGIGTKDLEVFPVRPETVGVLIPGKTDKNGKRIFEDDILLYKDDDDGTEEYLLVYYDEFQASFLLKSNESQYPIEMYNTDLYEVVGNQFDNPELLDKFSLWGYGNGK